MSVHWYPGIRAGLSIVRENDRSACISAASPHPRKCMSSYDEVCRVSVTLPLWKACSTLRERDYLLCSLGAGGGTGVARVGRRMFLRTSIARNACVTSSVHRQSIRIPAMIKNADESIAHGASGHAACISLTRNDTIDVEDCRLEQRSSRRSRVVTSRVAADERIPSCTRGEWETRRAHSSPRLGRWILKTLMNVYNSIRQR